MSGARRHCPAAVTDTERDMSRELNTAGKEHGIGLWQHRRVPRRVGHVRNRHPEQETVTRSKTPAGRWGHSLRPHSLLLAQRKGKFPPQDSPADMGSIQPGTMGWRCLVLSGSPCRAPSPRGHTAPVLCPSLPSRGRSGERPRHGELHLVPGLRGCAPVSRGYCWQGWGQPGAGDAGLLEPCPATASRSSLAGVPGGVGRLPLKRAGAAGRLAGRLEKMAAPSPSIQQLPSDRRSSESSQERSGDGAAPHGTSPSAPAPAVPAHSPDTRVLLQLRPNNPVPPAPGACCR